MFGGLLSMNYLRAGLQRNQSNGPPHVAIGLIQLSLLVSRLDKIQSEMQSSQTVLSPTAGEGVLNFTCDHNWFISPVFTDGASWAPHVYASLGLACFSRNFWPDN